MRKYTTSSFMMRTRAKMDPEPKPFFPYPSGKGEYWLPETGVATKVTIDHPDGDFFAGHWFEPGEYVFERLNDGSAAMSVEFTMVELITKRREL